VVSTGDPPPTFSRFDKPLPDICGFLAFRNTPRDRRVHSEAQHRVRSAAELRKERCTSGPMVPACSARTIFRGKAIPCACLLGVPQQGGLMWSPWLLVR